MTEAEERIVRSAIVLGSSKIQTAMNNNVSESTVYRVMDDFYERAIAILRKIIKKSAGVSHSSALFLTCF